MIASFLKSVSDWANDYPHSVWLSLVSVFLFVFGLICFVPKERLTPKPSTLALSDVLVLARFPVPEDSARTIGWICLSFAIALFILTLPTTKKQIIRARTEQQRLRGDPRRK
jgi:hypothetical protein